MSLRMASEEVAEDDEGDDDDDPRDGEWLEHEQGEGETTLEMADAYLRANGINPEQIG